MVSPYYTIEYVGGGSSTVRRLQLMEEEKVPRGKAIPPEVRRSIYNRYTLGESTKDIAESMGLSVGGVGKIIRDERKAVEEGMRHKSEKVVAGDKKNGRLTSTLVPNRWDGTHVVGGRVKSKSFTAANAKCAIEQWQKWCEELDAEHDFMCMVERKPKDEPFVPTDEPMAFEDFLEDESKVVCGYPGDPIEEITPEPTQVGHGPAYLLWSMVNGKPRFYGLYDDEDKALSEGERINEVAAFLGNNGAFEVEEVQWRQ